MPDPYGRIIPKNRIKNCWDVWVQGEATPYYRVCRSVSLAVQAAQSEARRLGVRVYIVPNEKDA
jgi:hypothetical protein